MKVLLGAEFAGYPLKVLVKDHLLEAGHQVIDLGQQSENEKVLYPQVASAVAKALQEGVAEKAILICGTGAGVCIVANKFKGVYAVSCESYFTANGICTVNDANVLTMGHNVVGPNNANAMVDAFLAGSFAKDCAPERTAFLGGMLADVKKIEAENMK